MQPVNEDSPEIIRQLLLRQADTEARLERLENSLIFRFLRWGGNKLGYRPRPGANQDYAKWIEQREWLHPNPQTGDLRPPSLARLSTATASEWRESLGRIQAEFTAIVPAGVQLSPLAEHDWLTALQKENTDAAYSDWDHLDSGGRRYSPRFTPGFSPELLRRTAYMGQCFVVRTELLKEVSSNTDPAEPGWAHALAKRVTESTRAIARVPRVLWHSTNAPEAIETASATESADPSQASIVICTRTPELIERCLRALRSSDAAQAEIVVVAHDCAVSPAGATVVPYSGQFHYGLMNQLGVTRATRPVVVLLNDDVEPIAPGWLGALLAPLRREEVGIAGGLLLYPDGSLQHAGISVGGRLVPAHLGRGEVTSPWWPWLRMTREVSAVTGACLALRRALWDQLDGFDRRFPVNYNDVDLCLRARAAGYSVILAAEALLHHHEAQSRNTAVAPEERALFTSLWTPALAACDPWFNPNLALPDERIALAPPLYTI